ncbi:protein translocase subunit SecF [Seleniivibrio woodruffii]|uniref:Protein-export membrane protein SecF n=1 Tax=Seleniivibrio woodruffii TaxID=1078050 RepID=A0A4R1K8N3_9BACT|nr:protein translocase subunit SecF [Seleniivibrio woodruffii]TCK59489.1 protein translocase subunit secF [Seleniivibrio woodruffii]TVZ35470.1 protein translocase subunit secF [Seleniivibrio woodruffii]
MFELIKQGTKIDFMGKAYIFFAISGFFILISLGLIFTKGFTYGIDFAGGTVFQVEFEKTPNLDTIRNVMNKANVGEAVIQNFGSDRDVLIRVEKNDEDLKRVSESIENGLTQEMKDNKFQVVRVEQVGPQVGKDLKKMAFNAVIYSIIAVLIYVAVRFQFVFASAAIIALVHDVIITLGFFSLLGKEISISVIAAVLTLVGYSLNDTIVIFDRIREKMREDKEGKISLRDLMNNSINETLSRTIITSFLTFLSVIALYFFGGEVINGFSFALMVGIIVGSYSSIACASALIYVIKKK